MATSKSADSVKDHVELTARRGGQSLWVHKDELEHWIGTDDEPVNRGYVKAPAKRSSGSSSK